jgi:uncharacterized integral membrane protein (TIGR00697 family)
VSNIITGKIIMIGGIVLPGAALLFPMVYIFSDIMTEVYGLRLSLMVIKMNALINLFMSLVFMGMIALPYAPFWGNQNAFVAILGSTPRIVVASLIAYFLGDYANSASLSFLKTVTKNRPIFGSFFLRAIGSSLIAQVFDTVVFILLAFYGTMPTEALFTMIYSQYLVKIAYEIVIYPLTKWTVDWWKKKENIDIYDEISLSTFRPF